MTGNDPERYPRSRVRFLLLVVLAAVPGCGPPGDDPPRNGEPPPEGFTVRDSADVEIVENHSPQHPAGRFWTIEPRPYVVLGDEDPARPRDPADSAHVAEVIDYAGLPDGRIAILSRTEDRVALFEASGRFSKFIGRRGRGPGEFQAPRHLQYRAPDTLAVWDTPFGPVSYFDTTGSFLGQRRLDYGRVVARLTAAGKSVAERLTLPLPD